MTLALISGPYPAYCSGLAGLLAGMDEVRRIRQVACISQWPQPQCRDAGLVICFAHRGYRADFGQRLKDAGLASSCRKVLITESLGKTHRRWLARGIFDLVLPMTISLDQGRHLLQRLLVENPPGLGFRALNHPHLQAGFAPDLEDLTQGEQRILNHVQQGLSNEAIARQMTITINTVKVHLARIYRKTGTQNRTQIAGLSHQLPARSSRSIITSPPAT